MSRIDTGPDDRSPTALEGREAERPPLAMEVLPFLEHQIIIRRLKPGTKLVEMDLCARYGISRSPMREALRMLEASGLVVRRPRFGVRVAPMSIQELDQIFACRVPMEALSARDLAENRPTDGSVEALHGVLDRVEQLSGGNPEETFFANAQYSAAFNRLVPNRVLARLIDQLSKQALRYRHLTYMERPQMIPFALETNRRVVDAVLAGRADEADDLTRKLVMMSWDTIRNSGVLPQDDS